MGFGLALRVAVSCSAIFAMSVHARVPESDVAFERMLAQQGTTRETADAIASFIEARKLDFTIESRAADIATLARREIEIRAKTNGKTSPAYARALGHLGYALVAMSDNDEASRLFEEAYAIVDAPGANADANTHADASIDRGYIRRVQRREFPEAVVMIESALASAPDLKPLRRAQALLWLAGCEWYLQHPDKFHAALDRAEAALRDVHSDRHPFWADLKRWRGLVELDAGRFPQAIAFSDEALARSANAIPYSIGIETVALDSRGQLEQRLGNLDEAGRYFEKALALQTSHPTSSAYLRGMMQYELCANAGMAAKPAQSEPHCRAAIAALEGLPSTPTLELAGALNNLAGSVADQGRDDEAVAPLRRSLDLAAKTGSLARLSFVAEISLADVYVRQGRYADAGALLRRHLERLDKNGDFALKNPRSTEVALAAALFGQHRLDEAFASAAAAETSAALVRRVTAADLDERRALRGIEHLDGGLDWMIAIAAASRNEAQIQQTWNAALDAHGTVTAMVARRLSVAHASSDPRLAAEWQALQKRNADLAQARVAAAREPGQATHDALIDGERAFDAAELALAAHTGSADPRLKTEHGDVSDVRSALPGDAVLVRFVEAAADTANFGRVTPAPVPKLYALIASRRMPPQLVAIGDVPPIAAAVDAWYRGAAAADSDPAAVSRASVALRKLLWDPLAPHMKSKRVLVIPSAALSRVNFAALEDDGGRFLVETGPKFHLLDHERDVMRETASAHAVSMMLAGAPDFDGDAAKSDARGGCAGLQSSPFKPLPGARAEIETLDKLGGGSIVKTVLEGSDATEAGVRRALPQTTIAHFATHGVFLGARCRSDSIGDERGVKLVGRADDAKNDIATLSALAFAGANVGSRDSSDDGLLTSEEIAELDLTRTDWAVLSACETGLGEVTAQEGVLGLRRAFQLAGARTVIMSLWRVDDRATTDFMRILYRARLEDHADTIDAEYAAMRETLASRRRAGAATHPYYWAAFVAAGDWR